MPLSPTSESLFLPPPPGYLDAAATAPRLRAALDAERAFYAASNANPRRALHAPGVAATRAFDAARRDVADFLSLPPSGVVFTSGATASLNLLAAGLPGDLLPPGADLFVSVAEHHADYLPWQRAAARRGLRFRILPLDPSGDLSPGILSAALASSPRPALVALTAMSNVLGRPQPVPALADVARRHGALLVLDVSQAVAHVPPSAWGSDWDFLAFSGHKIGAPMGIGVLAGRPALLERLDPLFLGGEMVSEVFPDAPPSLAPLPDRLEGGTPNAAGAVALAAAVRALAALPSSERDRVAALAHSAATALARHPRVRLLSPPHPAAPLFSFVLDGIHPHDAAQLFSDAGLALRSGHLCAQPLLRSLGLSACLRASFFYTNTPVDADALLDALPTLFRLFP